MPKRQRHSRVDEFYWDTLDNAAKIIPAVSDSKATNVFRLTAVLSEEVEPELLQYALERALEIFPAYAVNLRRGLFWYYFDINTSTPKVREESRYPCTPMRDYRDKGFLFRVTYFHKRINLEVFHVLSDGMGAEQFMHIILCYYFHLKNPELIGEEYIRGYCDKVARDFDEDSFAKNVAASESKTPSTPHGNSSEPDAYHIGGYRYEDQKLGVLTLLLPTSDMLKLAREAGATVSQYIAALIVWSIYNTTYRRSSGSKPITISLPVNLRSMFGSTTMRNFFGHVNIAVKLKPGDSFEAVLAEVKRFFDEYVNREYFERQIAGNVAIERITPIRFVPVWLKDIVMKILFARAEKKYTITLSNLGRVVLPEQLSGLVEHLEIILGGSRTHPKKCGLISSGDVMALSFSSTIFDNSVERFFVKFLCERGIEITAVSNETPPPAKPKKEKKPKKSSKSEAVTQ